MKVLFLTNIPSPYRVDFFNELGKHCELTVLYERRTATNRDIKWISNKAKGFKEIFLKGYDIGVEGAICFNVFNYLNNSFDLIVIGGYSTPTGMLAINYLKFKRIPFILNTDGGIIKKENKVRYKIKKYFISSASSWLSTSDETEKYLLHYGANKERIFKYPFTSIMKNDIIKRTISKEKIKDNLGIKERHVILSVGQFIHRKGFDVLIESMRYISKDCGVYIIGGRPTQEYLDLKSKYNLENLHFIDFMNKNDLRAYYQSADLFVFPTREDIWGLVINEAMANELPIITTYNCVAGLELITNGKNGFLIPINESKILAEQINELLANPKKRIIMGRNNLEKIENYTIENMAQVHIDIFNNFIKIKDTI